MLDVNLVEMTEDPDQVREEGAFFVDGKRKTLEFLPVAQQFAGRTDFFAVGLFLRIFSKNKEKINGKN